MATDNRTVLNDCEATTGWSGDDAVSTVTGTGEFYEGSTALSWQASDAAEYMATTQDSVGMGTFSLNFSDTTLYMLIKDNLQDTAANGGVEFVIGDSAGTPNIAGYDVGGNDAVGLPGLGAYYNSYKLDCSNRPASFTAHSGSEASIPITAITQIGYGCLHLAKANGPSDNVFMDCFRYIANGSYALTIRDGTSGTPETMADVVADDVTGGWGLVSNPVGSLYYFFGPTEFGTVNGLVSTYFEATGEQWFWLGDNGGGHSVGATHFPFRVMGSATQTTDVKFTQVAVINTGTGAEFDCSNADVDTLEIDLCSFEGLANLTAPQTGGTSRFITNTTFTNCGQIIAGTSVCDMSGCSFLTSTVAADEGAFYDTRTTTGAESITELDNCTFSQGTNAHHAIRFGTGVTHDITLTGIEFTGFSASNDVNGSTLRFDATSGSINVNLVGCTVDGAAATTSNVGVDDAAGITVTLVVDPVTQLVNVKDTEQPANNIENARVFVETAATIGGGEMFEAAVTSITQAGGTATCTTTATHGLVTGDYVVIRGAQPDGYNKVAQVTVSSTTVFTYSVSSGLSSPATGTPVVSFVPLYGTTNASGNIQASRTWGANQQLKGWARKKNASSPFYKDGDIAYTVDSSNGNTTNVVLQPDE